MRSIVCKVFRGMAPARAAKEFAKAFSGAQWDDGGTFGTLVTQFVGDLQALVIRACLMANVLFFALGVYTGPEPTRIVAKGDLDMSAGAADQFE